MASEANRLFNGGLLVALVPQPPVGLFALNPPLLPLHTMLRLVHVPTELTAREALLIFALVADDVVLVDLADGAITASFRNASTCAATGKLLDGRRIFGAASAPVKVEYDFEHDAVEQFGQMRLLNPAISPPGSASAMPASQGQNSMDFPRLGQRLRFLFSDFTSPPLPSAAPAPGRGLIDLSDLTGKLLLMMELLNDAREYDSLVRDWGQPFGLAPQTPGLVAPTYDWSLSQAPAPLAERRRTLLAFFTGAPAQPQTVAAILLQGPSLPMMAPVRPAAGSSASAPAAPSAARATQKEVPELQLLARVPPPANPADQNPPCNTLYVGNLPPDATEAELRALFSPQKGFRRLLFRTKNQLALGALSHNHGPMCFVEFEDVGHATVALAELYGRALPRPGAGNGKGGIRLLFSKNPLGVRGPGNPRRALAQLGNGAANGVGNYGYLNFH